MNARVFADGIGRAVADRTIARKVDPVTRWELPKWTEKGADTRPFAREDWSEVAYRVAQGNSALCGNDIAEFKTLHHHMTQASVLLSGRHLQHTDAGIGSRPVEVLTNCSTSASTFILFYLLLNGSGVGRCYDDDMMQVDWSRMPMVSVVIREDHPDVLSGEITDPNDDNSGWRKESYPKVEVLEVEDSREGWAKALERLEFLTWEGTNRDTLLVLDFSHVRERGRPIGGMQNRPASGPGPLMHAIKQIRALRDAGLEPWEATMHADHYAAECVLVGGARRAARMATKTWRDKSVIDFINVKRGGQRLWSSNNSVTVDEEFWKLVRADEGELALFESKITCALAQHAKAVFDALTRAAYFDKTGEPGLINVDKLARNDDGVESLFDGNYAESPRFKLDESTKRMTAALAKTFANKRYNMIVNPCVTADTWVQTSEGPQQVSDLIDRPYTAVVNGKGYPASGFWKTGDKEVFRLKTTRGYEVRATADHKFLVETSRKQKLGGGYNVEHEWVELQNLEPGDKLVLNDLTQSSAPIDPVERDLGWLLGEMVGDGGYNPGKYRGYVRFWGGEDAAPIATLAATLVGSLPDSYKAPVHANGRPSLNRDSGIWNVKSRKLDQLASGLISEGDKQILPALEKKSVSFVAGFLRGMFDADGSVQGSIGKGVSVRLAQSCLERLKACQRMLLRLGVASTIHRARKFGGVGVFPDGKGGSAFYKVKATHELVIAKSNVARFALMVGFHETLKAERLGELLESYGTRGAYAERFTAEVDTIVPVGVEAVYDCTVDEVHRFDANGIIVHNCGEIPLSLLGGYCVLADVVPFHAQNDDDAEEAFRAATRALIRVNTMPALYGKEVKRTNRIGVGFTGIFEYAFSRFGYGWKDLIDEKKSMPFWHTMSRFSNAVVDEARLYSAELGVNMPHTVTTCKPAGCATPDTLVRTTKGVKSLQDIFTMGGYNTETTRMMASGTWLSPSHPIYVMDENNEAKEVTKLYVNGVKPVFEIAFEDGTTVKLTGNHKLKTVAGWKRVDELTTDDEVVQF
jgi:intein/homing endonuclease